MYDCGVCMRPRTAVQKFCKDSKEVLIKHQEYATRGSFRLSDFYDEEKTEIFRSLWFTDKTKMLFPIDIDFHNLPLDDALASCLSVAREIEKRRPDQFLWKFSGRGIHGLTLLTEQDTHGFKDIRSRYSDSEIINAMAVNLTKGLSGIDESIYNRRGLIRAIGSINLNESSHMYNIPIELDWTPKEIIKKAREPEVPDWTFKIFNKNVDVSGIRQPRSYKHYDYDFKGSDSPTSAKGFPPCMYNLLSMRSINYNERKILIPFLRDMGWSVDKIYNIFKQQYGEFKASHIKQGREVERYFEIGYITPSCKTIKEMGLCPSPCGLTHPNQKRDDINERTRCKIKRT